MGSGEKWISFQNVMAYSQNIINYIRNTNLFTILSILWTVLRWDMTIYQAKKKRKFKKAYSWAKIVSCIQIWSRSIQESQTWLIKGILKYPCYLPDKLSWPTLRLNRLLTKQKINNNTLLSVGTEDPVCVQVINLVTFPSVSIIESIDSSHLTVLSWWPLWVINPFLKMHGTDRSLTFLIMYTLKSATGNDHSW